MGNGSGIKFLCCNNTNKESQGKDYIVEKNDNISSEKTQDIIDELNNFLKNIGEKHD